MSAEREGRAAALGNATRSILLRAAIGLVALAVLTACSTTSSPPPAPVTSGSASAAGAGAGLLPANLNGEAPSNVTIALTGGYLPSFLPTLLADGRLGYFQQVDKRFHTNIQVAVFSTAAASEAAIQGNTAQFVVNSGTAFLAAAHANFPQYGIFNATIGLGVQVSASTRYKSSRGTDITKFPAPWCANVSAENNPINIALELEAGLHDLKLASQLGLSYVGTPAAVVPSLQSGRCQIGVTNSETLGPAQIAGTAYPVVNLSSAAQTIETMGAQLGTSTLNTTKTFTAKYPALTQAIIDAEVKSLIYVQQNRNSPEALWNSLPAAAQQTTSLSGFTQSLSLESPGFDPAYNNGSFSVAALNDTLWTAVAVGGAIAGSNGAPELDPASLYSNEFVNQAYKDLNISPTAYTVTGAGSAAGPTDLPTSVGKPSAEEAKAFAVLSGKPAPANSGPCVLGTTS